MKTNSMRGVISVSKDFFTAVRDRRTFYGIGNDSKLSDKALQDLVENAVLHTPSAFNSQSARVVLLLREQHLRFWDITKEALRKIVPASSFAKTEEKIGTFASGYGTVLYFNEDDIVNDLQNKFPNYKANFPIWAQQANGMLQFVIWTALEAEGYGASLQHYNELVSDAVRNEWNLPKSWTLSAQMPFGTPTANPGQKEFSPIQERVKVFM